MLRLTESELDNALHAVEGHGYGDFFPEPPELALVKSNWDAIRGTLGQIDLDIYDGYPVLAAFAPKSRVNVRRVALLHSYDLIFYTALVLAVRDGLSGSQGKRLAGSVSILTGLTGLCQLMPSIAARQTIVISERLLSVGFRVSPDSTSELQILPISTRESINTVW